MKQFALISFSYLGSIGAFLRQKRGIRSPQAPAKPLNLAYLAVVTII
jgi:hypothetical protein